MSKLTKARREALEWFAENDGAKFYPVSVSRRMIKALVDDGMLEEQKPPFGFVRTLITPAGRAALANGDGE